MLTHKLQIFENEYTLSVIKVPFKNRPEKWGKHTAESTELQREKSNKIALDMAVAAGTF